MTKDEFRAQWVAASPAEKRELVLSVLDVFQEHVDPCENGHVDHTAEAHLGRRIVHSMSGGGGMALGADWDYDGVAEYIRSCKRIGPAGAMQQATGHLLAFVGGPGPDEDRVVAFALKFHGDAG